MDSRGARAVGLIFLSIVFASVYLGISGSVSPGELIFAIVAGVVAAGLAAAIARMAHVEQSFKASWAVHAIRPCADVMLQLLPMSIELLTAARRRRRPEAAYEHRRFEPGGSEDPESRGRRALVTLAISITPASLVCNRDVDCDRLMIASVGVAPKGPARPDPRWPA